MSLDIATGPRDLVFAASVDSTGGVWWSPVGESGPKDWRQCAVPQPVTRISAAVWWPNHVMPHGRRDIFAITRGGYPVHLIEQYGAWREDDHSTAPFGEVAPGSLTAVSAGSGASGHLEVFVVDTAGDIHHRWANDAAKGWSGWTAFSAQADGLRATSISYCPDYDASPWQFNLYITDPVGQIWRFPFEGTEGVWWQEGQRVPGPPAPATDVSAVSRSPGHNEIHAVTIAGDVFGAWSANSGRTWSKWERRAERTGWLTTANGATWDADGDRAVHHNIDAGLKAVGRYTRFTDSAWRGHRDPQIPFRPGNL